MTLGTQARAAHFHPPGQRRCCPTRPPTWQWVMRAELGRRLIERPQVGGAIEYCVQLPQALLQQQANTRSHGRQPERPSRS